jgi:hypothetical protein
MNQGRGRLVFAGVAAAVLVAAVVAVAVSGSSDADDGSADEECLTAWNEDSLARSDGAHAYQAHGYRATLVTRVDPDGEVIPEGEIEGPPSPEQRCAVIFASPQVDFEPDFGVRVFEDGRWAPLALAGGVELDQIAAMQRDATATANFTLLPDGRLGG